MFEVVVNLEQELLNQAARQMARDIDTEILMTAMNWKSLELSKGTVYGTEYLTVHPNNSSAWNEMMVWMIEQFGPSAEDGVWTPDMRWYANNSKFWFREEKDLTMFILRWS
jgi:hypothetical protein